jgi:hypothetical protein
MAWRSWSSTATTRALPCGCRPLPPRLNRSGPFHYDSMIPGHNHPGQGSGGFGLVCTTSPTAARLQTSCGEAAVASRSTSP